MNSLEFSLLAAAGGAATGFLVSLIGLGVGTVIVPGSLSWRSGSTSATRSARPSPSWFPQPRSSSSSWSCSG